ncbi:hypothetical protein TSOC_005668 [Tetrabaena socialis]|uniref:Uncharacterized protein n=1 Tax=Tetrabaena socialis TaxID=47790 RepID=A0A2J8A5Q9_9CHLO|nr:hypothetical protein TSOC_005668 [Tetrabaena socialis]|eukprot:PNH07840.1 hypothetical protein TSOC_005668 [Tetrabaena socialis]
MADVLRSQLEAGPRDSLLDVILARVAKTGKNVLITRIVFVARLQQRHTTLEAVKAPLARMVEKHSSEGEITGFLLCYPLCYIHVIEVVSSCEDVPGRQFNAWYAAFLPSASNVEAMDPLDAFGWGRLGVKRGGDTERTGPKSGGQLVSARQAVTSDQCRPHVSSVGTTGADDEAREPRGGWGRAGDDAVKSATDINTFLRKAGAEMNGPQDVSSGGLAGVRRRGGSRLGAAEPAALSIARPAETRRRLSSMESSFEDVPPVELVLSLVVTEVWPVPPALKY